MVYNLYISEDLNKKFKKLANKDRKQLEIINKKVEEIIQDPNHYKPLRGNLHGLYRVHIQKSFVLIFEIDEKNKTIKLIDYNHQDKIY